MTQLYNDADNEAYEELFSDFDEMEQKTLLQLIQFEKKKKNEYAKTFSLIDDLVLKAINRDPYEIWQSALLKSFPCKESFVKWEKRRFFLIQEKETCFWNKVLLKEFVVGLLQNKSFFQKEFKAKSDGMSIVRQRMQRENNAKKTHCLAYAQTLLQKNASAFWEALNVHDGSHLNRSEEEKHALKKIWQKEINKPVSHFYISYKCILREKMRKLRKLITRKQEDSQIVADAKMKESKTKAYLCACGQTVQNGNKIKHLRSPKHQKLLDEKEEVGRS